MDINKMTKTKSCPFCGEQPEILDGNQINAGYFNAVECQKCNFGIYRTNIKIALRDWNTRPAKEELGEDAKPQLKKQRGNNVISNLSTL